MEDQPLTELNQPFVAVRDGRIHILREGRSALSNCPNLQDRHCGSDWKSLFAGQLPTHYAPRTPLRLIEMQQPFRQKRISGSITGVEFGWVGKRISRGSLLKQTARFAAAANLFCYLRELDQSDLDLIVRNEFLFADSGGDNGSACSARRIDRWMSKTGLNESSEKRMRFVRCLETPDDIGRLGSTDDHAIHHSASLPSGDVPEIVKPSRSCGRDIAC